MRDVWIGALGGLTCISCAAVTLGPLGGQVLIGRPLDVRATVNLAPGEVGGSLCLIAKVSYADQLLAPGSIQLSWSPSAGDTAGHVRVQARTPVNETFVGLELTAGCSAPFTRNYVLLADPPLSLAVTSAAPVGSGGATSDGSSLPSSALAASVSTALAPTRPARDLGETNAAADPKVGRNSHAADALSTPRATPTSTSAPPNKQKAVPPPKSGAKARAPQPPVSRLKLEAVDLTSDEKPKLQASLEVAEPEGTKASTDAETEQKRLLAKRMWGALSQPLEVTAEQTLKLAQIEAELQTVKSLLGQVQAERDQLHLLLEEAQGRQYLNPVVMTLGGLWVLVMGVATALWLRKRRYRSVSAPWWGRSAASQPPEDFFAPSGLASRSEGASRRRHPDVDVDSLFPEEAFRHSSTSRAGPDSQGPLSERSDFLHSTLNASARSVATEELFDLQQQVEFFVSLGQSDQAIEVLKAHLQDSQEASPLAYLDLLTLYHELERRADYEGLRTHFNTSFQAVAPEYDQFSQSRRGLERYTDIVEHIQSLWPGPSVLEVIEASIFRSDSVVEASVLDLEAYRDLLLLYGIARDINESSAASNAPVVAGSQAPKVTAGLEAAPVAWKPDSVFPAEVPSIELDFDLSQPDGLGRDSPAATIADGLDLDLNEEFEKNRFSLTSLAFEPEAEGFPEKQAVGTQDLDPGLSLDLDDLPELESLRIKKSGQLGPQ